jgi:chromosomal replication initiation ATPase DnaA
MASKIIPFAPRYRNIIYYAYESSCTELLNQVCGKFNVSIEAVKSKSHRRELAEVRQIFLFEASIRFPGLPYKFITGLINQKHTAVNYGRKVVNEVKEVKHKLAIL